MGFGRTGVRECVDPNGCQFPLPRISELGRFAWFIFDGLRQRPGRWDYIVGPMGERQRTGLKLEAIQKYSEMHGIVIDGDLLDYVEICEAWQLIEDNRLAQRKQKHKPTRVN